MGRRKTPSAFYSIYRDIPLSQINLPIERCIHWLAGVNPWKERPVPQVLVMRAPAEESLGLFVLLLSVAFRTYRYQTMKTIVSRIIRLVLLMIGRDTRTSTGKTIYPQDHIIVFLLCPWHCHLHHGFLMLSVAPLSNPYSTTSPGRRIPLWILGGIHIICVPLSSDCFGPYCLLLLSRLRGQIILLLDATWHHQSSGAYSFLRNIDCSLRGGR